MFFFNDECDFRDDDQYDFFTLATQIERRQPPVLHRSFSGRGERLFRHDDAPQVKFTKNQTS
jgi:hypothetical protein